MNMKSLESIYLLSVIRHTLLSICHSLFFIQIFAANYYSQSHPWKMKEPFYFFQVGIFKAAATIDEQ